MDNLNQEKRSWNMSRIKSKNTKPEIIVKKYLFDSGIRYKSSKIKIIGKPDIVIKKYRLALFVNGCFWHAHQGCKDFRYPKSNVEFWKNKIDRNILRDNYVLKSLKELSYEIFVIWECEIKNKDFIILDEFIRKYYELRSKLSIQ